MACLEGVSHYTALYLVHERLGKTVEFDHEENITGQVGPQMTQHGNHGLDHLLKGRDLLDLGQGVQAGHAVALHDGLG